MLPVQPDRKTLEEYTQRIKSQEYTNPDDRARAKRTLKHLKARVVELNTGKLAGAW